MPWLAFGKTTFELHAGETSVGSGPDAGWCVSTADLMPAHFTVSLEDGAFFLRPVSDETVVVVNDAQVTQSRSLVDGDVVLAGSGRFVFSHDAPRTAALEPTTALRAFLVDDQLRVAHPLTGRSTTIGRDAANSVVVRDPTASRFHAEVRREAGGFAVRSMGAHGTALNDKPLTSPRLLNEGDVVEIAFTTLRFTSVEPGREISLAIPHSTANDASGRKPTLDHGVEQVVDTDNSAGRDTRRVQLLVAAVTLAAAVWWWVSRTRG